ncbi:MAG: hypothetical protein M0023_05325 [Desulfobacteraceae bacterium]|nr:hypothetical protein [Desulfobacteraceae bacterium]
MSARLLKNLKYSAVYPIVVSLFMVASAPSVRAEALYLPRPAETPKPAGSHHTNKQKIQLKLDEGGDLLIQCGCARFIVAYNSPTDQFKASEHPQNPQAERNAAINGISLTASLSF